MNGSTVQRMALGASLVALAACAAAVGPQVPPSGDAPSPTTRPLATLAPVATFPAGVADLVDFSPMAPGTYFIDPDKDPATPLLVYFTIPAEGWEAWMGTANEDVIISITTVTNLMVDGCTDQLPRNPPVGPSVEDLATALTELPPFEVAVEPQDVELAGYAGRYVELEVPDLHSPNNNPWTSCNQGKLKSWTAPSLSYAFWGYDAPGQREGFWILDVEGTRLVVEAVWDEATTEDSMNEFRQILESIEIRP